MNRNYITTSLHEVENLFTAGLLNNAEKLAVLANCLLDLSKEYLEPSLIPDIGNGKVLSYELIDRPNDIGLQIAVKAHLLLAIANSLETEV